MSVLNEKYGPWALITGGSSGIGEEFARQLAREGFNLMLAARRKSKLDDIAKELAAKHNVKVTTVEVDLSQPDAVDKLHKATEKLEIGLLVNNAGVENHGPFLEGNLEEEKRLLQLNTLAPMHLAHVFGAEMTRRGRGGILFVASTLAYVSVPFFANYAASKSYVLALGESLHYELKNKGVDVTVISPGLTETEMTGKMTANGVDLTKIPAPVMHPEPVVRTALQALGRKGSVVPGFRNKLMGFMGKHVFSRSGMTNMFGGIMEKAISAGT